VPLVYSKVAKNWQRLRHLQEQGGETYDAPAAAMRSHSCAMVKIRGFAILPYSIIMIIRTHARALAGRLSLL
jgi:hypothetical protein